jgi:hypothetical protein
MGPARVRSNGTSIRVTHSEYVPVSVNFHPTNPWLFHLNTLNVQPGNDLVFPWLSGIAARYETYVFNSLRFEFRTFISASTSGRIAMCFDYDVLDQAPTGEVRFYANDGAVDGPVWAGLSCSASREGLHKRERYYVRSATVPDSDRKSYDVGNLFIGVGYGSASIPIGQIFVHYDIEFQTPQLEPSYGIEYGQITSSAPVPGYMCYSAPAHVRGADIGNAAYERLPVEVPANAATHPIQFHRPWMGLLEAFSEGTSLEGLNLGPLYGMTAHLLNYTLDAASGSATKSHATWEVDASAGATFNPLMASAVGTPVPTSFRLRFAEGSPSAWS